jgi:hypothetical protein
MADYRSVQTRMWREDDWFQELDVEARLFWIYLFTNPSASPAGIYRLPLRTMAFESGVGYEAAQDLMRRFADDGKARYEDGVVWVVNMRRLQFPTLIDGSKEWQTAIRIQRDIDAIPDRCAMKAQYLAHSGYPIVIETIENGKPVKRVSIQYPGSNDTPSIPHPCPINTPSVNSNVTETETVTGTRTERARTSDFPPGFDEFERIFKGNLLATLQERDPAQRFQNGFSLADTSKAALLQVMSSGPVLSGKAIDWALDQWEQAKPNERFEAYNTGCVNWMLATIKNGYKPGQTKRPVYDKDAEYKRKMEALLGD